MVHPGQRPQHAEGHPPWGGQCAEERWELHQDESTPREASGSCDGSTSVQPGRRRPPRQTVKDGERRRLLAQEDRGSYLQWQQPSGYFMQSAAQAQHVVSQLAWSFVCVVASDKKSPVVLLLQVDLKSDRRKTLSDLEMAVLTKLGSLQTGAHSMTVRCPYQDFPQSVLNDTDVTKGCLWCLLKLTFHEWFPKFQWALSLLALLTSRRSHESSSLIPLRQTKMWSSWHRFLPESISNAFLTGAYTPTVSTTHLECGTQVITQPFILWY